MSELPPDDSEQPEPVDGFDEIVAAETDRDPDLAVIEAGSRTLRTQGGPPQADVPARPADPEVDKALREVEAELATRWGETKLEPSVARIAASSAFIGGADMVAVAIPLDVSTTMRPMMMPRRTTPKANSE